MKRRTGIATALMYALVLAVCIGVLYVMNRLMEPGGADGLFFGAAESREADRTENGAENGDGGGLDDASGGAGCTTDSAGSRLNLEGHIADVPEDASGEATGDDIQRETGYKGWRKELSSVWSLEPPEAPYIPPRIIIATDLHYLSAFSHDGGEAFQAFVEAGDGKTVQYLPELLEAFIDQVIEEKPSALVFSGDITMNGERLGHEELARRLGRVEEAGIPVIVIPGNHDINNTNAASYFGEEAAAAEAVDAEEFYEIYRGLGYDEALSRDGASLSYVYKLDEKNWLLMLDSCQYEPKNKVDGKIKAETLRWIDEQLAMAADEGIFVLPIAHHNLLAQSRMYTTQCAMENNGEVIGLLQKYELPLFLSGHLHVQRIRKHKSEPGVPEEEYGIQEIITDSISIPPCQYGVLSWTEDGGLEYETRSVDVSSWAKRNGVMDENLLDFEKWSYEYLKKLVSDQIRGVIKNLGEDAEQSMASAYAGVYIDYYAGRRIDIEGVKTSVGYRWWQRNMPDSYLMRELDAMLADSKRDNNYLLLPERFSAGTE